ncbi:MAG: hypothetical protein N3A54_05845, partial [Patescibacteria group bacterium]|nr:hypothetical protein [Patescibacteria group bacterium]
KEPKGEMSRREFFSLVGLFGFGASTFLLDGIFNASVDSYINRLRRYAPISSLEPASNDMRVREIQENPYSLEILEGSPMRKVLFGDAPFVLHLGVHGTPWDPDSVIPIEDIQNPSAVFIDGLPNLVGILEFLQQNVPLNSLLVEENVDSEKLVIREVFLDEETRAFCKDILSQWFSWIPPQDGAQNPWIAVDPYGIDDARDIMEFFSRIDSSQARQKISDVGNWTRLGLLSKIFSFSMKKEKGSTRLSRREFLRRMLFGVTACATAGSVKSLIDFLESDSQMQENFRTFFSQRVYPSEKTPRGFRGVVEYYLTCADPDSVDDFIVDWILRDLIASYKQRVLYNNNSRNGIHYAAWGAAHENQIGLLELSDEQLLTMIDRFVNLYKNRINLEKNPSILELGRTTTLATNAALYSATEYSFEHVHDPSHPVRLIEVRQFVFPQLYEIFRRHGIVE